MALTKIKSSGLDPNISITTANIRVTGNAIFVAGANVNLNQNTLGNVASPIVSDDAATKGYVDSALTGISSTSISDGDSSVTVVDSGTGNVIVNVDNADRAWVTSSGVYSSAFFFANGTPFVSGGGAKLTTSNTAPSSPTIGDMWYDTTTDLLLIYTDFGTESHWLDVTGAAITSNSNAIVGAGGLSSVEATANVTMTNKNRYIVDTASSAVWLTLPASAVVGDEVGVVDGTGNCNVNNITVSRNGHKIQGLAEDLTVSTSRAAFTLVYYNVSQGWLLTQV